MWILHGWSPRTWSLGLSELSFPSLECKEQLSSSLRDCLMHKCLADANGLFQCDIIFTSLLSIKGVVNTWRKEPCLPRWCTRAQHEGPHSGSSVMLAELGWGLFVCAGVQTLPDDTDVDGEKDRHRRRFRRRALRATVCSQLSMWASK